MALYTTICNCFPPPPPPPPPPPHPIYLCVCIRACVCVLVHIKLGQHTYRSVWFRTDSNATICEASVCKAVSHWLGSLMSNNCNSHQFWKCTQYVCRLDMLSLLTLPQPPLCMCSTVVYI